MTKAFLIAAILLAQVRVPAQIETGVVTGVLLSTNGTPAAGVRIAAMPVPEKDDKSSAAVLMGISQTDAAGRYRLDGIPPGRYYILAGLIDYPNYYPGTTALTNAGTIEVDSGATVVGVNFTMARPTAARVSGKLALAPTLSGTNSIVTLSLRAPGNRGQNLQATADAAGSFVFPQVPPGVYQLTAALPGSSATYITVSDHDVEQIALPVIDCNAGAEVRGKLAGNSPSPVRTISLSGSLVGCGPVTTVSADGSFVFRGVPEGTYSIQLNPTPLGWTGANVVVQGQNIAALELALPTTIEIRGRLVVDDGSVAPRMSRGVTIPIQAMNLISGALTATQNIDDDGAFAFRLVKGSYRISASAIPRDFYIKTMTYGSVDLTTDTLDLIEPASSDIAIVLGFSGAVRPGVLVSGRVIPSSGGALAKTEGVLLVSSSGGRSATSFEAPVGADGTFEFRGITPGNYDLQTVPDSPVALRNISVRRTDVTGIQFALPVLYKVNGVIELVAGSGELSSVQNAVSVQFLKKDLSDESERRSAQVWSSLGQSGAFQAYLPEGDYRFSITGIPEKLGLKAVTFGSVNILESDFRVRSTPNPLEVRVTLREK